MATFNIRNKVGFKELNPELAEYIRRLRRDLDNHIADNERHLNPGERGQWNSYDSRITNIENNMSSGGGGITMEQLQAVYDDLLRRINSGTTGGGSIGNIGIMTGLLRNGETIPLLSGYTEAQCRWFVTPWHFNDSATGNDIKWFDCQYSGRVVTATVESKSNSDCVAFYMIIGLK